MTPEPRYIEVWVAPAGGTRHMARARYRNASGGFARSVCGFSSNLRQTHFDPGDIWWRIAQKCKRCQRWAEAEGENWPKSPGDAR